MAEPETDIVSSAIKWLADDPTFLPSHRYSIMEVLKELGAEDPDDPLLVALVQEGLTEYRQAALAPLDLPQGGWHPEFCGEDATRKLCSEPVGGTGRCMACGSQRRQPDAPAPEVLIAQQASEPPETPEVEAPVEKRPSTKITQEEAQKVLDAIKKPRVSDAAKRKAKAKEDAKPSMCIPRLDAPPQSDVDRHFEEMHETAKGMTLTWRIKKATGASDDTIGGLIGKSRATIQAYAQDVRREVFGRNQVDILKTLLIVHRDMIDLLILELEVRDVDD